MKQMVFLMIGIIIGRLLKLLEDKVLFPRIHLVIQVSGEPSPFERWLLNQEQ